ncbi:MAG: TonB family protein [Gemmatimonadota bacterium]|nr:MAG: TonB family protein [Gemmatimonadota bacterium]
MTHPYYAICRILCVFLSVVSASPTNATQAQTTAQGQTTAQAQTTVQVIVHPSNPASAVTTAELEAMFLKRLDHWSHGAGVIPVDLPEQSPVRDAFSRRVHQKPTTAVEAFWQRQLFSGRGVPPVRRPTEMDVIDFVAATPGAVGYVSSDIDLPPSVKPVLIELADDAATQIYGSFEVDQLPELVSQPAVRYPPVLRQRGVEGRVLVEFVVMSDGRVDPSSVEVVEATNDQFRNPAERAVREMAFRPGRVQGESVAVRVQQSVAFTLEGRKPGGDFPR